ncbi:FadR/GntR family transcriptional regulator [Leifsonia sp. AG29]|uniref:FadR/GntR family transcriptional regulator n=1 Tax=Leifsonia sp. AG29 TaxID=2598860 RepID=UPI00131C01E4|nr:FadR/GntR family transcriptional regulator [Leifsonia sp. AG29]
MTAPNLGQTLGAPPRKSDILDDLQGQILEGALYPGQQLPSERELCQRYGVSRPVIREVLASMAEGGFIAVVPGRGSYVRPPAPDELSRPMARAAARAGTTARDLVAARVALECASVELAAMADESAVGAIEEALRRHNASVSLEAQARTDLEFHQAITAASGNPVLLLMFGAISEQIYQLMLRSHSDGRVHEVGDPLHETIVEAIKNRDPQHAALVMKQHLLLALELYGDDLDRSLFDVLTARGLPRPAGA